MSNAERPLPLRAALGLLAALVLALPLFALLLFSSGPNPRANAGLPIIESDNVSSIARLPGTIAISGVFSRSAPYFYVSGVDSVSVIDVSDPRSPVLKGKLPNAMFENEAMTLGERKLADGSIQRFLLLGNDLAEVTAGPNGVGAGRINGKELIVVDVTDPTNPKVVGRTPNGVGGATTSTHTVACADASCTYAYTAGTAGKFSIIDLHDLTKPVELKTVVSAAAKGNAEFASGAGHHWNFDGLGLAWHTGSGGTEVFDISDTLNPKPLNGTDPFGRKTPYNDFIHHNSMRPNAAAFAPGKPLSVANGNVVLVTEEDYANDGDEVECDKAGTFQTWSLPDLDGEAFRARNPNNAPDLGTMTPLDIINPPNESKGGLSTPVGGFCSAHWFDYNQAGIVAQGFYQQGLRLIDVRDPSNLKQFGFATGGGTEVWDAYWAPERSPSGKAIPGHKLPLVYTVDVVRGVEVFEVTGLPNDLPVSGDAGDRGTFPAEPAPAAAAAPAGGSTTTATTPTPPPAPGAPAGSEPPAGTPPTSDGVPIAGTQACGLPTSRITRRVSRLRTGGAAIRGTARGHGCQIAAVHVAVGRKVRSGCRWLQEDGTFGATRSCDRTGYVRAAGTTRWTLARSLALPPGEYLVWSRAIDDSGKVERKASKRNLLKTRVRP